ncbi:MAG: hypothetical protein GNW80_01855 [Asgard group archaeon]|nr:hypothetical protein [Asgard group archaeon]
MSEEALVKIPGTTFSLKFGLEGKYYAVYLVQGKHAVSSKKTSILQGTTLKDLPEEIGKGMRFLMDSEEVYISPVIVDRVVNDLLEQIPKDGQVFIKETTVKPDIETSVSVLDMIEKSDHRAGKKSIMEYTPSEKPKYDATASDIGRKSLKTPKPLPKRSATVEHESDYPKPAISAKDDYLALEEKLTLLTNEVKSLQETIDNNKKAITSMKKQITTLKKSTKEIQASSK